MQWCAVDALGLLSPLAGPGCAWSPELQLGPETLALSNPLQLLSRPERGATRQAATGGKCGRSSQCLVIARAKKFKTMCKKFNLSTIFYAGPTASMDAGESRGLVVVDEEKGLEVSISSDS